MAFDFSTYRDELYYLSGDLWLKAHMLISVASFIDCENDFLGPFKTSSVFL